MLSCAVLIHGTSWGQTDGQEGSMEVYLHSYASITNTYTQKTLMSIIPRAECHMRHSSFDICL